MTNTDYWRNYWQNDAIIYKDNLQSKVGRTLHGTPISDEQWNQTIAYTSSLLECEKTDVLLDLCAGSGVFSSHFSSFVKEIHAIDISETLLRNIKEKNVVKIVADAVNHQFEKNFFDKVIFYFALQHFTLQESFVILNKLFDACKEGAVLLIGDIPDIEKKYDFFNTNERKKAYFESLPTNTPIIGEWFLKADLLHMAKYVGFSSCSIIDQPEFCINSHYRFDLKLIK